MRRLHILRCTKYLMPASIPTEFPASMQGVTTKQKIERGQVTFLERSITRVGYIGPRTFNWRPLKAENLVSVLNIGTWPPADRFGHMCELRNLCTSLTFT